VPPDAYHDMSIVSFCQSCYAVLMRLSVLSRIVNVLETEADKDLVELESDRLEKISWKLSEVRDGLFC
jgi:hypothetical protein